MDQKKKAVLWDLLFGALIAALVIGLKWGEEASVWHRLCDGFFVAAVMLLGVGGLRFVRNRGAFDVMGYSLMTTMHTFLPFTRGNSPLDQREEDFLDYRERKQEKRKSGRSLLLAGSFYLVLALIALAVYSFV